MKHSIGLNITNARYVLGGKVTIGSVNHLNSVVVTNKGNQTETITVNSTSSTKQPYVIASPTTFTIPINQSEIVNESLVIPVRSQIAKKTTVKTYFVSKYGSSSAGVRQTITLDTNHLIFVKSPPTPSFYLFIWIGIMIVSLAVIYFSGKRNKKQIA